MQPFLPLVAYLGLVMYFLVLGIVLLLLKYAGVGPAQHWSWYVVMVPFGLAVVWWAWADKSGYSARQLMQRNQAQKHARVQRQRDSLQTSHRSSRHSSRHASRR